MSTIVFEDIRNPYCKDCSLCMGAKTVCLMGRGNEDADIMFVGEAPGEDEDKVGRPFIGRAGKLLTNIMSECGIQRKEVYITNVVKCRPPDNRKPYVKELRACRKYIVQEIQRIKPKVIIGLGRTAMESLLEVPSFTIASNRGNVHYSKSEELKGIPILCTYHPAAIVRDNTLITFVFQDFDFILKVLRNGAPVRRGCTYKRGVAPKIKGSVSVDLETTGLNPYIPGGRIICFGTSTNKYTGYCDTNLQNLRDIVCDKSIEKIGHNIKFDIVWCWKHDINFVGPIYDTLVAEHLLDENTPSLGLKELAMQFTDMGAYSAEMEQSLKSVKGDMSKVSLKTLMKYCAQDVDAAIRLRRRQYPKLEKEGLLPLFSLVMAGEMLMARAEFLGVKVDQYKHRQLEKDYRKRIKILKKKIITLCDGWLDNPRSSTQLGKVLTQKFGLPVIKKTKKGQVSVDIHALEEMLPLDKHGIVKRIIRYRNLTGDYSKYLSTNRTLWQPDGKVHCQFNIAGTDTGRYTCVRPNLQQVPKKQKSPIKTLFISRFKGGKIMNIDYDQGELRILAQESRDKNLIKAFKEGLDIHRQTASLLFGVDYEEVTDKERFVGKTINFGIAYGMGADKLANTTGMSMKEASEFLRNFKGEYDGIKRFIRDKENEIVEKGYVTNLFGRRRRINIVDIHNTKEVRRAQRQAVNSPIQGGLHDLNVLSMVELDRAIRPVYKSRIILAVHDSCTLDCPEEEVDKIKKIAKEVFENPDTERFGFKFIIPLTVSIGVGNNWMEASE